MSAKPAVALTDEQHAFARRLVEDGRFPNVGAVLAQGLDLLRLRIEAEQAEAEALGALLARRASGEFVSAAEMDDRLERLIDAARGATG